MMSAALALLSCRPDPGAALAQLAARVPEAPVAALVPGARGGVVLVLEDARFEPEPAFTAPEADLVAAVAASDAAVASLRRTGTRLVDAPRDRLEQAFDVAHRVETVAAPRTGPFASARDLALSQVDLPGARARYVAARHGGLQVLAAVDAARDEHGTALADAAIAASIADDTPVAVLTGLDGDAVERELSARGATFAILRPPDRDSVVTEYAVWRTGLDALFPEPPTPSIGLPTLDPWLGALAPRAEALRSWTAMPAIRAAIRVRVGPPPPLLDASSAYRARIDEAAARLASVLAPGSQPAEAIGDPQAALAGMDVRLGRGDMVMKYDALYHCLKVAPGSPTPRWTTSR